MIEQLYQLTERDLQTLLVEPVVERGARQIGIGTVNDVFTVAIPADRMLVLASTYVRLYQEAATIWSEAGLLWTAPNGGVSTLVRHEQIPAATGLAFEGVRGANVGGARNLVDRTLMTPAGGVLSLTVGRSGDTGIVFWDYAIMGWLIPRGNFGRHS